MTFYSEIFTRKILGRNLFLERKIGSGTFGEVYLAFDKRKMIYVAIKFIAKCKVSNPKKIMGEFITLATLNHLNIVKIFFVFETDLNYALVTEYVSGEELFYALKNKGTFTELDGLFIFRQLISAVKYMHRRKIVHGDIKPENIIINHNLHVKLLDFGFAKKCEPGEMRVVYGGTHFYNSPEVLEEEPYLPFNADIWLLGATILLLFIGYESVMEDNGWNIYENIRSKYVDFKKIKNVKLRGLIRKMLHLNANKRPTIKEVSEIFDEDLNYLLKDVEKANKYIVSRSTKKKLLQYRNLTDN